MCAWEQGSIRRIERIARRHEIRDQLVPFKGMRQSVKPQSEVECQTCSDLPVVIGVEATVIVDPVLAFQILKLSKARSIAVE